MRNLRHSLRTLVAQPLFIAVVIITCALGMFSLRRVGGMLDSCDARIAREFGNRVTNGMKWI